jgi:hypothetical protein
MPTKAKKKGELVVADKTFKYVSGDESELKAYTYARRYLRDLHDAATKRVNSTSREDN